MTKYSNEEIFSVMTEEFLKFLDQVIDNKIDERFKERNIDDLRSPYLSVRQSSEYAGVSVKTIYSWLYKSLIPYSRPSGGKCMIRKADLDSFINKADISYRSKEQIQKEARSIMSMKIGDISKN
jgi:excisionase family DNA binding protein